MYSFVCSILKHQLNTNTLDENGTCISNGTCNAQFNIVSVLLKIIIFKVFGIIFFCSMSWVGKRFELF